MEDFASQGRQESSNEGSGLFDQYIPASPFSSTDVQLKTVKDGEAPLYEAPAQPQASPANSSWYEFDGGVPGQTVPQTEVQPQVQPTQPQQPTDQQFVPADPSQQVAPTDGSTPLYDGQTYAPPEQQQPYVQPEQPYVQPEQQYPPGQQYSNDGLNRSVRLEDGSVNVIDATGHVIFCQSADGSKTRQFTYGDPSNPDRITEIIIDGNQHYARNQDGQVVGVWYGDARVDRNGIYTFDDYTTGEHRAFYANTQEIRSEYRSGQTASNGGYYAGTGNNGYYADNSNSAYSDNSYYAVSGNQGGVIYDERPFGGVGGNYYRTAQQYDTGCGDQYSGGGSYYQPQRGQVVYYENSGCQPRQAAYYGGGGCNSGYDGGGGYYYNNGGGGFRGNGNLGRAIGQIAVASVVNGALNRAGIGYGGGWGGGYGGGWGGGYGGNPWGGGYGGNPWGGGYGGNPWGGGYGGNPWGGGYGGGWNRGYGGGFGGGNFGRQAAAMGIGALISRIGRR